jgi:predicted CXXCH cytochrome family protein
MPRRVVRPWQAFLAVFVASLALTATAVSNPPAAQAQAQAQTPEPTPGPSTRYNGPDFCGSCHEDIHAAWQTTRHAQAFSSPVFQQDWQALGSQFSCLTCHTTGYDPASNTYTAEVGHPEKPMPITPDASLCATCHKTTTDEWRASRHGEVGINCQSCHDPHSQKPKADSITALCTNCHNDPGQSFTHSTHANAGLECSSCHMYTGPQTGSAVGGLVATGHTFSVGSDTCIGCHQDTVHSRDTILALTGELEQVQTVDPEVLRQQIQSQQETITSLEASSSTRLYTGLAQGAIVGLIMGGTAAWVVSRRLKVIDEVVEVDDDPQG